MNSADRRNALDSHSTQARDNDLEGGDALWKSTLFILMDNSPERLKATNAQIFEINVLLYFQFLQDAESISNGEIS